MDPKLKFAVLTIMLMIGFSLVPFANTIYDRPSFTPFGENKEGSIQSASVMLAGIALMSVVLAVAVRKHA